MFAKGFARSSRVDAARSNRASRRARVAARLPSCGYRLRGASIFCDALDWDVLALSLFGLPATLVLHTYLARPRDKADYVARLHDKLASCAVAPDAYDVPAVGRVVVSRFVHATRNVPITILAPRCSP